METTTISLIDSGALFREGVKGLLESEGFKMGAAVASIENYLSFEDKGDDLVLLNGTATPESVAELHNARPDALIVVMSDQFEIDRLRSFFTVGVDGYLLKTLSSSAFISSIRLVLLGEKVFPTELATMISSSNDLDCFQLADRQEGRDGLSDREIEVVRLLSEGASNKDIANKLTIAEATVKVHLKSILRKLGLGNRTQAAIWAVRNGRTI